jgi:hypothetical protein
MRTMGLVLTAGIAFGQPALWEQHMKEGDAREHAGLYKEARAAYQLALKDEEKPSDSGFRQAAAWNNLALINRYLGYLTGQSLPILRRCRRGLVDGHHVHFAQAGCGLQELSGCTQGLTSKS